MVDLEGLLKDIDHYRQMNAEKEKQYPELWKLMRRIHEKKTDDEWLAVREELRAYVRSEPPEDCLQILRSDADMLCMVCSAIEERRA